METGPAAFMDLQETKTASDPTSPLHLTPISLSPYPLSGGLIQWQWHIEKLCLTFKSFADLVSKAWNNLVPLIFLCPLICWRAQWGGILLPHNRLLQYFFCYWSECSGVRGWTLDIWLFDGVGSGWLMPWQYVLYDGKWVGGWAFLFSFVATDLKLLH